MRPKLELLDKPLIERILDEAFQLIEDPGVWVAPYVEDLLRAAGITVKEGVAHIPEVLARRLLDLVPRGFCLYDRLGKEPAIVQVDKERVDFWIKQGAQPSDSVRTLIARHLTPAPAPPAPAATEAQ